MDTVEDQIFYGRLTSIIDYDLNLRQRDNYGSLCYYCDWSINTRPEFDFPDHENTKNKTISNGDTAVCLCGENIDCEFCGQQLSWVIEESGNPNSHYSQSLSNGFPLGVDMQGFTGGGKHPTRLAYLICKNLHPQGPLPRPPQIANQWFRKITSTPHESIDWNEEYFNRLMSSFEVFYQVGLSIGAVEVGIYLAWHLSQEGLLKSASMVLEIAESLLINLNDDEKTVHGLDIDALSLYVDYLISIDDNKETGILEIQNKIKILIDRNGELSAMGLSSQAAPQFLFSLMRLIDQ